MALPRLDADMEQASLRQGLGLPRVASARRTRSRAAPRRPRCTAGGSVLAARDALAVDLAAPGAGLRPAPLDERLEALQIALHALGHDAERAAHVLHHALGVVRELEVHPGLLRPEGLE